MNRNSSRHLLIAITTLICIHVNQTLGIPLDKLKQEINKAQLASKPVNLSVLVPNVFSKLPGGIKKLFDNFIVQNVQFVEQEKIESVTSIYGSHVYKGRGSFTCSVIMKNNITLQATISTYEDKFKNNLYTFSVQLPEHYKLSQVLPSVKVLDSFALPRPQFVFSEFSFKDSQKLAIYEGLNFIAHVDLKGPFKLFGLLKDKAKKFDSIIVDVAKPAVLSGAIPTTLTAPSFMIQVPIRLGVDFTKIQQIPSDFSNFLQKITTDDFFCYLTVQPPALVPTITLQTGVQITTSAYKEPLIFQGFGTLGATGTISFGGIFPNTVEITPGIAIGDMGLEIVVDPAVESVLAALGIPISGLGFRGEIQLGKDVDTQTSLELRQKIELTTEKGFNVIFNVIGKNIDMGNLIYLLSKVASKTRLIEPIAKDKIPSIKFNKVMGRFAPLGGMVARKKIEAGLALQMDTTLFGQDFGIWITLKTKKLVLSGKGWMPPLQLKVKDKTIFEFTGSGRDLKYGTKDDSPYVHFNFDFNVINIKKMIMNGAFAVTGKISIPPLQFSQQLDILYARHRFSATAESNALGFGVFFDINIDPVKWREMYVEFAFKNDFDKFLSQQAIPALEELKKDISHELSKVDAELRKLSETIGKAQKKGVKDTTKEIHNTEKTISRIKNKIKQLKKECSNAGPIGQVVICPKVGVEITAQGTALAAQETYLHTLLKPGKEVIKGTTQLAKIATKQLADAEILKKTLNFTLDSIIKTLDVISKGAGLFKIKEVRGRVSAQDLAKGKLPLIEKFIVEMNLPGQKPLTISYSKIAFDFTNPIKSAQEIAKALIKPHIKIG